MIAIDTIAVENEIADNMYQRSELDYLIYNPSQFITGLDIPMMYREMHWASKGYLWEMVQQGNVDIEKMDKDFTKLMAFWKSIYLRKE